MSKHKLSFNPLKFTSKILSQSKPVIAIWDIGILITILGWILHYRMAVLILFIPYLITCYHFYKLSNKKEENIEIGEEKDTYE